MICRCLDLSAAWQRTVGEHGVQLAPAADAHRTSVTPGQANILDLDYAYGTTANNGNVLSQTITVQSVGQTNGFTAVQTYSYDSLNRLKDVVERPYGWTETNCTSDPAKCWKQTFSSIATVRDSSPSSFANQAVTNLATNPSNNRLPSALSSRSQGNQNKKHPSNER